MPWNHLGLTSLAFLACTLAFAEEADLSANSEKWFESNVRPVLETQCVKCHGEKKQEADLRLDSRAGFLKGGESGPAVVVNDPSQSLFIEAIKHEGLEMPPNKRLTESQIKTFEHWVANGLPWPNRQRLLRASASKITDEDRNWWAFRPLRKPAVPLAANDRWSVNEIDRFIRKSQEAVDITPANKANKVTLVRRLYFDLIGLPPTPDQIDEFVNDSSPDAWKKLIDQLLDNPAYGEHWARHWLDLVRYAESDGWNQDAYRPHIWRYRDYVVNSFNEDKPYPEFVRQQIAGDQLDDDNPESLAATGYLRLGIYEYNQRDAKSHWNDIVNELTDVTGDVFLGMGIACARCHDHKFDPVLQADYFKLRAFFEPVVWRDDIHYATQQQIAEHEKKLAVWKQATADIQSKIDELIEPYHVKKWKTTVGKFPLDIQACFHKPKDERTSWEDQMAYLVARQFEEEGGGPLKNMKKEDKKRLDELNDELAKFDDLKPSPLPQLMVATNFPGEASRTIIPEDPDLPISPGYLTVLTSHKANSSAASSAKRRLDLAEWITRADNPLTMRVVVNRIWQQHFGRGLVGSPNDFGRMGQRPTHPELLDWLTAKFIEENWSFKNLHKRILMSATWQQASQHAHAEEYQRLDPSDNLYWRAPIRRLTAEQIRDSMLATTGELDRSVGGFSVAGDSRRRSLYVKSRRNTPDPLLHAFDVANGLQSVADRNRTTTPTQSLLMINGKFSLDRARALAKQLQDSERKATFAGEALNYAFRAAWGRAASDQELLDALQFVGLEANKPIAAVDASTLHDFCHVLFNADEFIYLD